MYPKMSWDKILSIAAHPDYYGEYDKKCAIYHLNNAIDHNKILIAEYKNKIELIKRGSK